MAANSPLTSVTALNKMRGSGTQEVGGGSLLSPGTSTGDEPTRKREVRLMKNRLGCCYGD